MVWSRQRTTVFLLSGLLGLLTVGLVNFSPLWKANAVEQKVMPAIAERPAQATAACGKKMASPGKYQIVGNANTVQWGYFSKEAPPVLAVHSKDEDEAYSLMTVSGDFAITQVVDGNWGVHGIIPKAMFEQQRIKSKPIA